MSELRQRIYTSIALIIVATLLLVGPSWLFTAGICSILTLILGIEWPRIFAYSDYRFWLIMPIYPILPFILLIKLKYEGNTHLIILLCAIISVFDTSCYLIGKALGTHKLCASISPGKTWEGFIGGTIITLCFIYIVATCIHVSSKSLFVLVTLTLCIAALLGDLFESYLKRRAGLKDSGTLLPGHGGLLDRLDSIMFAVPLLFLVKTSLINVLRQLL